MIETLTRREANIGLFGADVVLSVVVVAAYPSLRAGLAALLAAEPGLLVAERSPAALLADDPPALGERVVLVAERGGLDDEVATALARTAATDSLPLLWIGDGPLPAAADTPGGQVAPTVDRETLAAAVRAVAAGLHVRDPRLPLADPTALTPIAAADPLTPREHEVLTLVAAGHPNKAIARALGISEHTVKFHVSALLGKLNATSRTEAVTLATRRGLLSL